MLRSPVFIIILSTVCSCSIHVLVWDFTLCYLNFQLSRVFKVTLCQIPSILQYSIIPYIVGIKGELHVF